MLRGAVLLALAVCFVPCAARAAGTQAPVVPILAPLPGDLERASLLRPAAFVSEFRVPRADGALYVVASWYVHDFTVAVVGPGSQVRTFVATDDVPGHVLGVRLPPDAWQADRIELRATTVSAAGVPYLIDADDLAAAGWRYWWYAALFGLFASLALLFAVQAAMRRRATFGWFAALAAGQAGLVEPWLGLTRPPPEISQPLHAAWQALVFASVTGLALRYVRSAQLPRSVAYAGWALAALATLAVALGDVLQDFWTGDAFEETAVALLLLYVVALGAVAVRHGIEGAWFFLSGTVVAALTFVGYVLPLPFSGALRDWSVSARGIEALLLAIAIGADSRGERARIGGRDDVDGLTGVANRAALDAWLARSGRNGRRGGTAAAVLLDLDRFRAYNDTYGHAAGDDALRRVAALIARSGNGAGDLAGRYGDDQFLVLLDDADLSAAKRTGDELSAAVAALGIAHGGVPSRRLSVSAGVASMVLRDGDRSELIRRATAALYVAKTMGRNRVVADENAAVSGP